MKLKRIPEDFRVEELPTIRPGERGRFVYYRLTKRGLGTPEAIEGRLKSDIEKWRAVVDKAHIPKQ